MNSSGVGEEEVAVGRGRRAGQMGRHPLRGKVGGGGVVGPGEEQAESGGLWPGTWLRG